MSDLAYSYVHIIFHEMLTEEKKQRSRKGFAYRTISEHISQRSKLIIKLTINRYADINIYFLHIFIFSFISSTWF